MPSLVPSSRLGKPGRKGLFPARGCAEGGIDNCELFTIAMGQHGFGILAPGGNQLIVTVDVDVQWTSFAGDSCSLTETFLCPPITSNSWEIAVPPKDNRCDGTVIRVLASIGCGGPQVSLAGFINAGVPIVYPVPESFFGSLVEVPFDTGGVTGICTIHIPA